MEHRVLWVAGELDKIERDYFPELNPQDRPVFFHCTVVRNSSSFLAKRRPNPADRQLALLIDTWTKAERTQFLSDVYRVFRNQAPLDLVLFCVIVDKSACGPTPMATKELGTLRYERAFEELYATANAYLRRHHQERVDLSRGLHGHGPQKGILLMDRSSRAEMVKSHAAGYRRAGTRYGSTAFNVVETPVFLPSTDSRLLQLADFGANAVLRGYRPKTDRDSRFFDETLLDKFDRDGSECHGLLHIQPSDCDCPARHYRALEPPLRRDAPQRFDVPQ